jgi:uncharacterized repeat protein (TIGR03987 family)
MLVFAIISITTALIFYTIGVWSEKWQGKLKKWHFIMFCLGLVFDTLGTTLMSELADNGFELNFHGVTGLLAIVLMFVHALWAAIVLMKNNEKSRNNFHRFSIVVWIIWLIPFISGAMLGMAR